MTRLRIAHVTPTFLPYLSGTTLVAWQNAEALARRGHEVTILTGQERSPDASRLDIEVRYLPALFRYGNAALTPSLIRHLDGFDVVHLHYPFIFGAEVTTAATPFRNQPMVLTYHNELLGTSGIRKPLFALYRRAIEPLVLRRAAAVIAVRTDHLLAFHPELACDPRLVEIPNGVDTDVFQPGDRNSARLKMGVPKDAGLVMYVGALDSAHPGRDIHGLMSAFAASATRGTFLALVGEGDMVEQFRHAAGTLGIGDRTVFPGRVAHDELAEYYRAADISVLPSTGSESFGLVLLESLACGTPVIGADLPGVRQIVRHGEDGLLTPAGDRQALGAAILDLLRDPARRAEMGRRGVESAQEYGWQEIARKLEELYRKVYRERHDRRAIVPVEIGVDGN